jgi:uncharacterized membrane protein YgdD (TMEM256/DUF423 family)
MKNQRGLLILFSILGALAVIFGAFGAHGIKPHIDEKYFHAYETGVSYHFYHTTAVGIVIALGEQWLTYSAVRIIVICFFAGIVCFSGSLYGMAFGQYVGLSLSWLGPITPIGGLFFIVGWVMLLINLVKNHRS